MESRIQLRLIGLIPQQDSGFWFNFSYLLTSIYENHVALFLFYQMPNHKDTPWPLFDHVENAVSSKWAQLWNIRVYRV